MPTTKAITYRMDDEVYERLRDYAHEHRMSIQSVLEHAVRERLSSGPAGVTLEGLREHEALEARRYIRALRHGDPDIMENISGMIRSALRLARKLDDESIDLSEEISA